MTFEYTLYDQGFNESLYEEGNDRSVGNQPNMFNLEDSSKSSPEESRFNLSKETNDNYKHRKEEEQHYNGFYKTVSVKPRLMIRTKFDTSGKDDEHHSSASSSSTLTTSSSSNSRVDADEMNYSSLSREATYYSKLQHDINLKFATEHSLSYAPHMPSEQLIKDTFPHAFKEDTNMSPVNWRKYSNLDARNGNNCIYENIKPRTTDTTNDCYRKLDSVLDELITSEKKYIQSLLYIIKNYLSEMSGPNVPIQLRGKTTYLFANIENIYEFHKNVFYPALEKTIYDFQAVARVFINCKNDFYMYAWYTMNSYRSSQLMSMHGQYFERKRHEIDDKLGLANHLLVPNQRFVQYCKLSSRMTAIVTQISQNERNADLQASMEVVIRADNILQELKTIANDAQLVPFIYNCPLDLSTSQILIAGKLIVNNNKRMDALVFLFDKLILITERQINRSLERYLYKSHIMLCEMKAPLKIFNSNREFVITNYKGVFKQLHLKAANPEERDRWCDKIIDLLQQEFNKIKQMVDSRKFWKANMDLNNCTINLEEQGVALKCGKLTIKKRSTIHIGNVMLYEKILIFTKVVNNHFSSILIYDDSIKTKYLQLCNHPEYHVDQFCVSCRNTNKSFILQAKSPEEKSAWTTAILDIINKLNNSCLSIIDTS